MRWKRIGVGLVLALLLGTIGSAAANDIRQGDQCVITAQEVVEGDLFVLCRTLAVRGTVKGNLLGASTSALISGTVEGSVYLLAGQLDVYGDIRDDLHFIGPVLRLQGNSQFGSEHSDLIGLSLSTSVARTVTIPGSLIHLGYQLLIDGEVNGSISYLGSALTIDGPVGGDVDATVGDPQAQTMAVWETVVIPYLWDVNLIPPGLAIGAQGSIAGDLRYASPGEGSIGGTVAGATIYTQTMTQPDLTQIIGEERQNGRELSLYLGQVWNEFLTLSVIGLLGLWLLARPLQQPARHLQHRPLPSFGIGLLAFVLSFPLALLLILASLLVIFILWQLQFSGLTAVAAALLGVGNIGLIGLFYFLALVVSRVIVALIVGRWTVRLALGDDGSQRITVISLIVGILLLALLGSLPAIGWIVNWLTIFFGTGGMILGAQAQFRSRYGRSTLPSYRVSTPALASSRDAVRQFPPPIIDDGERPVGMDNLPEGFKWWDD